MYKHKHTKYEMYLSAGILHVDITAQASDVHGTNLQLTDLALLVIKLISF